MHSFIFLFLMSLWPFSRKEITYFCSKSGAVTYNMITRDRTVGIFHRHIITCIICLWYFRIQLISRLQKYPRVFKGINPFIIPYAPSLRGRWYILDTRARTQRVGSKNNPSASEHAGRGGEQYDSDNFVTSLWRILMILSTNKNFHQVFAFKCHLRLLSHMMISD